MACDEKDSRPHCFIREGSIWTDGKAQDRISGVVGTESQRQAMREPAGLLAQSSPHRASFFLIPARFSGVDRTRIVSPSAS